MIQLILLWCVVQRCVLFTGVYIMYTIFQFGKGPHGDTSRSRPVHRCASADCGCCQLKSLCVLCYSYYSNLFVILYMIYDNQVILVWLDCIMWWSGLYFFGCMDLRSGRRVILIWLWSVFVCVCVHACMHAREKGERFWVHMCVCAWVREDGLDSPHSLHNFCCLFFCAPVLATFWKHFTNNMR